MKEKHAVENHARAPRDRRMANSHNWLKGRYGHTVSVTKPTALDRKAASRAKAKVARKSRKKNR